MSDVTERALVPAPTATRIVDQMASERLVRREVDPEDRRRLLVQITPAGRDLHRELKQRIDRERETIVAHCDSLDFARLVMLLENLALLSL